jgi:syringomycin synthetase protein SyrE
LFRTGDLGRYLPDGNIEFLGRNDFQVKIRGFRIELGEIEAALSGYPGVGEAVVLAREDSPGDKRLVAYYTTTTLTPTNSQAGGVVGGEVVGEAGEPSIGAEVLRAHLLVSLPEHMVPAAYVVLAGLPLTANGKLDRSALPAPGGGAFVVRGYEAPRGEVETVLARIWAELLGVERVGRGDNFFELGGHSLLAVRVVSHVRQVLGAEITLTEMLSSPVLSGFAQTVNSAARSVLPPITVIARPKTQPTTKEPDDH